MTDIPSMRSKSPPASREPYEQPDDPNSATVEVAKARGLKPEEVLAERRRVLRSRI